MISLKTTSFFPAQNVSRRQIKFIDRRLQLQHILMVVCAAGLGLAVAVIPIYYYLDQNYRIFANLAIEHSPELLESLERERVIVNVILLIGSLATLIAFSTLSYRMTNRIVGPLKVLRNHLRLLTRGDFRHPAIKVRDSDEFQDLIDAYNYFYLSFRTHLNKELFLLQKITVDSRNTDSVQALEALMSTKMVQLGRASTIDLSSSSAEVPDSPLAS